MSDTEVVGNGHVLALHIMTGSMSTVYATLHERLVDTCAELDKPVVAPT